MSKLVFNRATHQLMFIGDGGKTMGSWAAYNHVDSHASIYPHIPSGVYIILDKSRPHPHAANPDGPYGSYGIIRFNVPDHVGIGVHSGRADSSRLPGPQHPTMGCIRTSDTAMKAIKTFMATEPLSTIRIVGNSVHVANPGHLH